MQFQSKMLILDGNLKTIDVCIQELRKINSQWDKTNICQWEALDIKFGYYMAIVERLIQENRQLTEKSLK